MSRVLRSGLKLLAVILVVFLSAAAVVVAYLAYPGTPAASHVLAFRGYILLPQERSLNVADYLTLSDRTLFVTQPSSGSVFKVALNAQDGSKADAVSVLKGQPRTHGVALIPGHDIAFVSRSEANTVDAFQPSSMRLVGVVPVADDADAILYDPAANLVYVSNGDAGIATLIDPVHRTSVGTIALGGKPEFAVFDPATQLVYQNLNDKNAVLAVDLLKRRVAARWPLAGCDGPTGLAVDSRQGRLFVGCGKNSKLVVLDLKQERIIAALDVGRGPDSVAYDPLLRRIYTTGIVGTVTVIQQNNSDKYEKIEDVRTHFGAHTLVVDPVSHMIYVAYSSLFVAPRVAVFSAIP